MVARKPKGSTRTAAEQEELLASAQDGADEYIDLSNVVSVRGGAVPAGLYLCELESVESGVTGANAKIPGQRKLALTWKILQAEDESHPQSGKIFKHLTLVGDQAGRSRNYLEEDLGFDLSQRFNPKEAVGIVAWLTVSVQKNNAGFNNIDKTEVVDEETAD